MSFQSVITALAVVTAGAITACAPPPEPENTRHILFVGNSYTFQHNVPNRVAQILTELEAPANAYTAHMVADGGVSLTTYVDDPRILRELEADQFDYIVLQDRSTATFYQQDYRAFFQAVSWFNTIAEAEGAELVLFQTWPRRIGHEFYAERARAGFTPPRSPQEMQFRLAQTYSRAAKHNRAQLAPVGACWLEAAAPLTLYSRDGSHASDRGAHLAARVIANTIAGVEPVCPAPDIQDG